MNVNELSGLSCGADGLRPITHSFINPMSRISFALFHFIPQIKERLLFMD
jgi:hypothetical protein